ncbi:MAG TPA: hypothetical protein DCE42_28700, partial [Myxococcales bacterium]|nr:hypothetical protein [Myxococcales bacterium]
MQHPIKLQLTPGFHSIHKDSPTRMPVLLECIADTDAPETRSPLHLTLCIDTSSSMTGQPLELVLLAIQTLAEHLTERDSLALVSFASETRTWLPLSTFDQKAKKMLKKALKEIKAYGGTGMYEGLRTALFQQPERCGKASSRVLLLSDGMPNEGPSSAEDLSLLVRELKRHTTVSTFGFGSGHDESMLKQLSEAGGGGYTFIDSPETVTNAFAMELGGLFSTVAKRTRCYIRPTNGTTILGIRGTFATRYTHKGIEIPFSDMIAGQETALLMDIECGGEQSNISGPACIVELEYTPPNEETRQCVEATLTIDTMNAPPKTLHPDVSKQILLLETGMIWKQAQTLASTGKFIEAARALEGVLQRLQQHRDYEDEESEIRDWFEQLTDESENYMKHPDLNWHREFRQFAQAEMQMPGQLVASAPSSPMQGRINQAQEAMMQSFAQGKGQRGRIDIFDARSELKESIELCQEVTIGRTRGNHIVLPNGNVSKR